MPNEFFIPNPKCPWVTAQNGTNVKVLFVDYVDADHSGGNLGMYVYTLHKKFQRWGVPFRQNLPGSFDDFATRPNFVLDLAGGGFNEGRGETGPFEIVCGDATVKGMGMPEDRHVIYVISFNLVTPP